jgi:hypothetical protein
MLTREARVSYLLGEGASRRRCRRRTANRPVVADGHPGADRQSRCAEGLLASRTEEQRLITSVSAVVESARGSELMDGFRELIHGAMPEGLLRTEQLRGQDGTWRIQSLWRDRDALLAARDSREPLAALELFRRVGPDHTHEVFTMEVSHER